MDGLEEAAFGVVEGGCRVLHRADQRADDMYIAKDERAGFGTQSHSPGRRKRNAHDLRALADTHKVERVCSVISIAS